MSSRRGHRKRGAGRGGRLADMSVPADQRGRRGGKPGGRVGGTPPAQMSHGTSRRAKKKAREGEQRMQRDRRRGVPTPTLTDPPGSVENPGRQENDATDRAV